MNHDAQLGFDVQPDRYANTDRETIDLIRDAMTDEQFIAFCWGQVVKYRDRSKNPEADGEKARFYETMALHVSAEITGGEVVSDPRHWRRSFVPYRRRPYPAGLHGLQTVPVAERSWYDAPLDQGQPVHGDAVRLRVVVVREAVHDLDAHGSVRLRVRS